MTTKNYLFQVFRIDDRIRDKLEQAQSLRNLSEQATSTTSVCVLKNGTRNIHRLENVIVKMVDMENVIYTDLNRLINLKHEIDTIIKCVENPELRMLLELRYLSSKSWEDIAKIMNFSIAHVFRLHGRALTEVDAIRYCER